MGSSRAVTKVQAAILVVVVVLAVGVFFTRSCFATGCAPTAVTTSLTQATGAGLDPALIEAAKKEGTLVAYVASPAMEIELNEFGKKFGIRVEVVRLSIDQLVQRVSAEAGGSLPTVDIIEANPDAERVFEPNGWIVKYTPPGLPAAMKESDYFTRTHFALILFVYNPTIMKPEDLPKTLGEIADPKYKGKFCIADPNVHVSTVNLFLNLQDLWGQDKLGKWLKAVYVDNQAIKQVSLTPCAKVVESGQAAFGLTYDTTAGPMIQAGEKIKYFFPDDIAAFKNPDSVGIYFKAPHPNAAKLQVNWISQLSVQNRVVSGLEKLFPAHPNADPPDTMHDLKGKNVLDVKTYPRAQYQPFVAWFKTVTGP